MSFRLALRQYVKDSGSLGPELLLSESESCITIFDKYPKAMFHFLVLPKLGVALSEKTTLNLASLLKGDKAGALDCLQKMAQEAETTKSMIQDEMVKKYGFQWDIFIGFHAVPSMDHIHLHVLSSDLCAPALKKKHHYNSFRPDLGFFIHLDDVLQWFDLPPATPFAKGQTYELKVALPTHKYEPLLKKNLECFKCKETFKTLPQLKLHLQKEWEDDRDEHSVPTRRKIDNGTPEITEP